jgi:hypothetical protein
MSEPGYIFEKATLGSGWSYPLKRSVLDAALSSAGVTSVFEVRFQGGPHKRIPPLVVTHVGVAAPYGAAGKVRISVTAVRSVERQAVMSALEAELPTICGWIKAAEAASMTWRDQGHQLVAELHDGQIVLAECPAGDRRLLSG